MWLIDTRKLELVENLGGKPPPYAILSHTWDVEEVTFRDMSNGASAAVRAKKGFHKIEQTCRIALEANLHYAWVDTCCIDKSSSAELTEAINSMYQYYEQAKICYAYLSDFPPDVSEEVAFPDCRWFTRGWTLQELLAPANLDFYDASWKRRRNKTLVSRLVSQVTGIDWDYLWDPSKIIDAAVSVKMSWASRRTTTRIEDMAYCLLGLFDINMPMLYGEGQKAFLRLQEEIIKRTNDLSLLAWKEATTGVNAAGCGVLARSPAAFRTVTVKHSNLGTEFSLTNKGIKTTIRLRQAALEGGNHPPFYILGLGTGAGGIPVYLVLVKLKCDLYARHAHIKGGLLQCRPTLGPFLKEQTIYLVSNPNRTYSVAEIDIFKQSMLDLYLPFIHVPRRLKVFQVFPESVWDAAASKLVADPSTSLAILLGDSTKPYGSHYLVVLKRQVRAIYFLPASHAAMPYILSKLEHHESSETTAHALQKFWDLKALDLDPGVPGFRTHDAEQHANYTLYSENLQTGNFMFRLWVRRRIQRADQYGYDDLDGIGIEQIDPKTGVSLLQPAPGAKKLKVNARRRFKDQIAGLADIRHPTA